MHAILWADKNKVMLSSTSSTGFSESCETQAIERLCDDLLNDHRGLPKPDRRQSLEFVRSRVALARKFGLSSERDVRSFVTLDFFSAGRFAADAAVHRELSDTTLPADGRVLIACSRLDPGDWIRVNVANPPVGQ